MLEGTLDSFTLPDVFQLLSLTKKSGCLRLRADDHRGRVYFEDGQVYYAQSSHGRLALGRRLAGAGLVTTAQLQAALEVQRQSRQQGEDLRLGRILVDDGVIGEETLETFVREQIQDAVFDLMRWTDGSFSFDTDSARAELDQPVQLTASVENLIMEGSRRLEEWGQIRRKIPSLHAVVDMAPTPGEQGVEVNLKPEEWRLLTVVDGRRTVQDLVDLFGQGEFQTCRVLYGLEAAGLLEIRDPALQGPSSIAELLGQQELLAALEADVDQIDVDLDAVTEPAVASPAVDAVPGPPPAPTATAVAAPDEVAAGDAEPAEETVVSDEIASTDEHAEDQAPTADEAGAAEEAAEPGTADAAEQVAGAEAEKGAPAAPGGKQLTTDPSIDADLVRRLIDGVKGL